MPAPPTSSVQKTLNTPANQAAKAKAAAPSATKAMGASLGSFSNASAVAARSASASRPQTSNTAAKTSLPTRQTSNAGLKTDREATSKSLSSLNTFGKVGLGDRLTSVQSQRPNSVAPQRPNGIAGLKNLQALTARSRPSMSSIVAGDPAQRFGMGGYQGEISDYATKDIMGQDAIGRTLSAALSRAEVKKDIADRVPSKATPTAVAGYQNPPRAFPTRAAAAPVQVASYQNPGRAFPARPRPQESNFMPKTALPASLYAGLQKPPSVGRAPVTVADVPQLPFQDVRKGINLSSADMLAGGYGAYQQSPAFGDSVPGGSMTASLESPMAGQGGTFRSPQSAAQYNRAKGNMLASANAPAAMPASSNDVASVTHPVYDEPPTTRQRIAGALQKGMELRAKPFKAAGDWINEKLGGSPYNDLYGRPNMGGNQNTRDPLNSEHVKELIVAAQSGDKAAQEQLKKWFVWNQWPVGQRPATV